jgi:hypothetical protein
VNVVKVAQVDGVGHSVPAVDDWSRLAGVPGEGDRRRGRAGPSIHAEGCVAAGPDVDHVAGERLVGCLLDGSPRSREGARVRIVTRR